MAFSAGAPYINWIERGTPNAEVGGSSPPGRTTIHRNGSAHDRRGDPMRRSFTRTALVAVAMVALAAHPASSRAESAVTPTAEPPAAQTSPRVWPNEEPVNVQVVGAVLKPGKFALTAGSRLSDALRAGGVQPAGDPPGNASMADRGALHAQCAADAIAALHHIYLSRTSEGKRLNYMSDVARAAGDLRYDPLLREGDVVYVPVCRTNPFKVIALPPMP